MATRIATVGPWLMNTTDFRLWGKGVSDMFAAVMTRASDTGQIDWATVIAPGAGQIAGYEIFRFNDSLQATVPIFVKIEYGSNSANSSPNMFLTAGRTTNGAGTLSNIIEARRTVGVTSASSSSFECFAAGDGSYMAIGIARAGTGSTGQGLPNYAFVWVIDRTRDAQGVATAEGVYSVFMGTSPTATPVYFTSTFIAASNLRQELAGIPIALGSSSDTGGASTVTLFPLVINMPAPTSVNACFGYWSGALADRVPVQVPMPGGTKTYYPAGAKSAWIGGTSSGTFEGSRLAVRWE